MRSFRLLALACITIALMAPGAFRVASVGTRPPRGPVPSAAGRHCQPLPTPTGPIVHISTETALREQARTAANGTTLLIAPGYYDMEDFIHVTRGVTLRGATGNRDDVCLDFGGMVGGHFGILVDADDVTIANLTIRNANDHGVSIQGVDRPMLYNLRIVDVGDQLVKVNPSVVAGEGSEDGLLACSLIEYTTTAPDDYTNGISAHAARRWVVRDSTFARIRGPEGDTGPAVLFWSGSADTIIERNLFLDCFRGVAFGNPGQAGINHTGGVVRNNMFVFRQPHDVAIEMARAQGWLVAHNTAWLASPTAGLTWGLEARYGESQGTFAYNLTNRAIWANRDGANGAVVGNITTAQAEWFVDALHADVHLRADAAQAVDQAAPLALVTDDYDGEPRYSGAAPDVGADEAGTPAFRLLLPLLMRR